MRVMVLVKENVGSEAGQMPDDQMFVEMGKYNVMLAEAGVLIEADGLLPSSAGKRVRFDGDERVVIDGPFPESKDLVAGYWIWRVGSIDEAVDWLKKAPFGGGVEIEIRPIAQLEELGVELPPEVREQEGRLQELAEKNRKAA